MLSALPPAKAAAACSAAIRMASCVSDTPSWPGATARAGVPFIG